MEVRPRIFRTLWIQALYSGQSVVAERGGCCGLKSNVLAVTPCLDET